jgi:hypothetical protein
VAFISIHYFDKDKSSKIDSFPILVGQAKTRLIPASQELIVYGQALLGQQIFYEFLRAGETEICIDLWGIFERLF